MDLSTAQAYANETFDEAVELLRTLARIPAPTGHEEQRAEFVASWLTDAGAKRVWIDEANNVLCWIGEEATLNAAEAQPGTGNVTEATTTGVIGAARAAGSVTEAAASDSIGEQTAAGKINEQSAESRASNDQDAMKTTVKPTANIEVFSAHTDVVFNDLEPLPLREEDGRMYAPGIGDDTANLVNLLLGTRWLLAHPEAQAGRSILVVANSCEEGLGNLRGTRAVYERFGKHIASHVTFDLYLGGVVREAVGSLRWRICCDGPGGHSFGDFGRPNAIVELARLACSLDDFELPSTPKTTRNVGTISGGSTVNTIAAHAEMLFELRSVNNKCLQAARHEFECIVDSHNTGGVRFSTELLGERPGNGTVPECDLEALCARACEVTNAAQGVGASQSSDTEPRRTTVTIAPGSTDANIPLSLGIPAVCMGTVRGGGAHTRGEWIETASLRDGLVAVLGMLSGEGFE